MKKINKALIVLPLLFATILAACSNGGETSVSSYVPKEEKSFMSNGVCDYQVVIPKAAVSYEELSANTFVEQFKKATGLELDVLRDDEVTFNTNSKFISIGLTSEALKHEFDKDASKVKASGYRLVNNHDSIFVVGCQPVGTLYGTYDLLHDLINYEAYSYDEIHVDSNVKDIIYNPYNVTYDPPVEATQNYEFGLINNTDYAHVMKNITGEESWVKVNGLFCHTAPYLIPDSQRVNHPEWFGTDGSQLCYSQGIEDDEMLNYLYNNLKVYISAFPNAKYVSVSQADVATWCQCERCTASKERYGSNLAVMIKFVNKVADLVKRDFPERDLYVHTFSYHQTTDPIVDHFDEVQCRDNVTVMFAPIRGNYTKSFDDPSNANLKKSLEAIGKVCSYVTLWSYAAHFPYWFLPYNVYTGLKDRVRIYAENNVQFIFDQGEYSSNVPGFRALKTYLLSKVAYDLSLNVEDLTNNFFDNYYGPASKSVRQYFEEFRCRNIYNIEQMGMSYDINGTNALSTKYWPFTLLRQWQDYLNQALEDIDYLKYTDMDAYEKFANRIVLESISVRYLLIELFGASYYTTSQLYDMCVSFREDCYRFGITQFGEGRSLEALFERWGI